MPCLCLLSHTLPREEHPASVLVLTRPWACGLESGVSVLPDTWVGGQSAVACAILVFFFLKSFSEFELYLVPHIEDRNTFDAYKLHS